MRKISAINFSENQNTLFMLTFSEYQGIYNVETCCRAAHVTDENIKRRMHFAYWFNKVYKRSQNILNLLLFYSPHCYFCTHLNSLLILEKEVECTCMKAKVLYDRLSYSFKFYACLPSCKIMYFI